MAEITKYGARLIVKTRHDRRTAFLQYVTDVRPGNN